MALGSGRRVFVFPAAEVLYQTNAASERASEQDVESYVGVMVVSVCGGWGEARQPGYFPEGGT